jgi:hypothetical protein
MPARFYSGRVPLNNEEILDVPEETHVAKS